MTALVAGVIAFVSAAIVSPVVLRIISGRVVDLPNQRSSHSRPTPRGGGIAVIIGVAAGLTATRWSEPAVGTAFLVALLLGAVGLLEDIRGLHISVRLGLQATVSAVGLVWLLEGSTYSTWRASLVGLVAIFWLIGFTNAFNFMDGIDGISSVQLIVAGAAWAVLGALEDVDVFMVLGAITVGASLGFLPWNFPRARFFMGDVGSYFSGGWLAALVVIGIQLGLHPVAMIAPLLVYGFDTTSTLARRIIRGENWLTAHRSHIYQRLVVGGWSHVKTTSFFAAIAATISGSAMLWLSESPGLAATGSVVAAVALALYLASPTLFLRQAATTDRV